MAIGVPNARAPTRQIPASPKRPKAMAKNVGGKRTIVVTPKPFGVTLLDLFDGARLDRGGSYAVGTITYDALHERSLRVAGRFAALGLARGDRIALYCENRQGFIDAYLAALRCGIIAVPINVLYRETELKHVLEDAGVRVIVASSATRAFVEPFARTIVSVESVESWARDDDARTLAFSAPRPDDVAIVIYTSGTTGRSKGAMLTHGNLAAIASQLVSAWRWQAHDTLAIALPFFHLHGLGAAINGTFAAGARLLFDERFDPVAMLSTLRRPDVTMFFGVPTMYVRLLEELGSGMPPDVRLCVSGSAALSDEIHRQFAERFGLSILERYGATEFGFALGNRYAGPRVPGSVGVPFPGVRVRTCVPGTLDPVLRGEPGELLVSGPNVFAGYWNDPAGTEAAFVSDSDGTRWYRSGDLAADDGDVVRIVGRLKELIISGGFNIYPREIENEIDRFPGVRASAVIGIPDARRGELPIACVEADRDVNTDDLLAYVRERLASFKVPRAIYLVDSLPRNAMGKIEKATLRTRYVTES